MKNSMYNWLVVIPIVLILIAFVYFAGGHSKAPLIQEYNFESEPMTITVNFTDRQTIRKRMAEINNMDFDDVPPVRAFATLRPNKKECDIYTLPVRYQNDTEREELLGHELLHCLYGRWHPGNEEYSTGLSKESGINKYCPVVMNTHNRIRMVLYDC